MPQFIEGELWGTTELARAAALFRGSEETLLGIFKLSPEVGTSVRMHQCCAWRAGPCVVCPCFVAPYANWVSVRQRAVMDGTMVVVTDRTLYRDVNVPPETGTELLSKQLTSASARFEDTRCDGCVDPPTGAYSGKLPLDRLQTVVSSADPRNVIHLDEDAPLPERKPSGCCCCTGVADALWPQHHLTVTMAPHGMALRVYLGSEDELRGAMALLPKAAMAARKGEPTVASAVKNERRRRLSLVPMAPLVMERAQGEEVAALEARYSRRDSAVDSREPLKPTRRRKASIQWADQSMAQRASARISRISGRVWPARASASRTSCQRNRVSAGGGAQPAEGDGEDERWSTGGDEEEPRA